MSYNVTLYEVSCDRRKIDKTKSWAVRATVPCNIKEPCSVTEPIITISASRIPTAFSKINYAWVPDLNRYYFIDKIEMLTHDQIQLSMTVDVLMSYKDYLMNNNFEVARSEDINSRYFVDSEQLILCKRKITDGRGTLQFGMFPEDSTGNKYVLTVAGGGV